MRTSFCKSLRSRLILPCLAGLWFLAVFVDGFSANVLQARTQISASSTAQTKAVLSKTDFAIIEGKFHDGLGTFAEINLANEIIKAAKLSQPLFDLSNSEARMREAIRQLPESHPSRMIFQKEIANIQAATLEGARALLNRIKPATLSGVRHTAREFADAKAGDLRLEFTNRTPLPVSVKTDKSRKVAIAEGQTPHLGEKWAKRYFKVSEAELKQLISELGFASLAELKSNYLHVARLVAEVLIRKLKLVQCHPGDFSKAKTTDLEAVIYLLKTLRSFKSGMDKSCMIIFERATGAVRWESLLDGLNLEDLTPDRITFLPSKPRHQQPIATEFGIRIDHRTVVTFQVKHKRGRWRGTIHQFEFSDITTRLRI